MLSKKRRRVYFATPPSKGDYKPCRAHVVPSVSVCAYNSNAMDDVDEAGTVGRE